MADRICSGCHRPYYRVNTTAVWTLRNEGHRAGWVKAVRKLCLSCCPQSQAARLTMMMGGSGRLRRSA